MFGQMKEALMRGQIPVLCALVSRAREEGVEARTILKEGLLSGMEEVGALFASGKLYIPEVMLAARAMQSAVDVIRDDLKGANGAQPTQTVVLGTVQGDQHDIGKNLVRIMLEGAGFQVVDLGTNVAAERFVQSARDCGARLIALSALLTTTMPQMETVVQLAHEEGIMVMIGGAPVSQHFCDKIGADGYAKDAAGAAVLAKELLK